MNIITREELKRKLDRGDNIKLLMALSRQAYDNMHIPGSLHFNSAEEVANYLAPDDEIIVYCSNPLCPASINAYHALANRGYKNLSRYAGGLAEWTEAGYPVEGMVMSY